MSDNYDRPDDWERYTNLSSDIEELSTRKEQVAYVLNRHPETRNSDKELWLRFLEVFHDVNPDTALLSIATRSDLPSQTVVTRARADLQNSYSLYLPTQPEVIYQRTRNRRTYERVFRALDTQDEGDVNETYLYVDESGTTERYLIFALFYFLNGFDLGKWVGRVLQEHKGMGGADWPYFHFNALRESHLAAYKDFIQSALEQPSARVHVHIFDLKDARGPKGSVLARTHETAILGTAADLLNTGVIDEARRLQVMVDKSQDHVFYSQLELQLEPQFALRKLRLTGVSPINSRGSHPIQAADIIASSIGRRLNTPGNNAKDELSGYVLDLMKTSNPLDSHQYANVVIKNHSFQDEKNV